jgi:hypothetical protein
MNMLLRSFSIIPSAESKSEILRTRVVRKSETRREHDEGSVKIQIGKTKREVGW